MLKTLDQSFRGETISFLGPDVPTIMYRNKAARETMRPHRGRHKAYRLIRALRYSNIDQVGKVAAHLQRPFNPLCVEGREIDIALLTHLVPHFHKELVIVY